MLKRAVEIYEKALGPDHPHTRTNVHNLAVFYANQQRFLEAEPYFKRELSTFEKTLGIEHPEVALLVQGYAHVLEKLGRGRDAHKLRARLGEKR